MSEIRRWGIIRLVWEGRRDHLKLVVWVEVGLRMSGMERTIGLGLPVVFVVVMVGMSGYGRWRVIWNHVTGRRLMVERIVLFVVGHWDQGRGLALFNREEDGGRQGGTWCDEGRVFCLYCNHVSTTSERLTYYIFNCNQTTN